MPSKIILIVMAMVIVCMMLFGNKKVRILSVLIKQLQVFKNAKTDKISVWDIVCFIFFPIVLSVIITFGFGSIIDDTLAGVLTTVFALYSLYYLVLQLFWLENLIVIMKLKNR